MFISRSCDSTDLPLRGFAVTAWVVREDEVIVLILILCDMVKCYLYDRTFFLDGE